MFHKLVYQHMHGAVGFLICIKLQIYQGIFQWKSFVNRLKFDRIMVMSLWPRFLARPVEFNKVVMLLTFILIIISIPSPLSLSFQA